MFMGSGVFTILLVGKYSRELLDGIKMADDTEESQTLAVLSRKVDFRGWH